MTIGRAAQDDGESRLPQAPALSPPPVSPLATSGALPLPASQSDDSESVPPTVLPCTVTLRAVPSSMASPGDPPFTWGIREAGGGAAEGGGG